MSLETQIANLVAATNQLTGEVSGKMTQIDQRVEQKRGELDAWRSAARHEFVFPTTMRYGNVNHNKAELLVNNAAGVSADPAKSKWVRCGMNLDSKSRGYFTEGSLVVVCLDRAITAPPGHFQNPPYSSDWSATHMQFVIANESATSEGIDARLAALGITPELAGAWADRSLRVRTTAVSVPSLHPSSQLFVRFVNLSSYDPQGRVPQDILSFGGGGIFAIDHVAAYPFSF